MTRTGGPEVLEYVELPTPEPGADEVLVKAHAIGVCMPETAVRKGTYKWMPKLPAPVSRDLALFLGSTEGQEFFSGNWPWFAAIVLMGIFNTALGEELLFRGLLLPRMQGVFGRRDWVANGVLFGLYHLHVPWTIPVNTLDTFLLSYPAKRYRSALLPIAVHSAQTVVLSGLVLAVVLQ